MPAREAAPDSIRWQAERIHALARLMADIQLENIECRDQDQRETLMYMLAPVLESECIRLIRDTEPLKGEKCNAWLRRQLEGLGKEGGA